MKVKVCYACVHVTGTFSLDIRIDQNTPFFNKRPHPTPLAQAWSTLAPRASPQTKCLDPPLSCGC